MKAKIDSETGRVEWIGRASGEQWVQLPEDLPDQTDDETTSHYDSGTVAESITSAV